MQETKSSASDITGIILAGGRSARMGTDKARLPFRGATLIEHILAILRSAVETAIIVANHPAAYAHLAVPVTPDVYPGCGPLAGLHAGLRAAGSARSLVLSCDIPLIEAGFLRQLIACAQSGPYDVTLPQTTDGRAHPLCAVYSQNCLPIIERSLADGRFKLEGVYRDPHLKTKMVTPQDFAFSDALLTNINTPMDYTALL